MVYLLSHSTWISRFFLFAGVFLANPTPLTSFKKDLLLKNVPRSLIKTTAKGWFYAILFNLQFNWLFQKKISQVGNLTAVFCRDPYNGLLESLYNWIVFHPFKKPNQQGIPIQGSYGEKSEFPNFQPHLFGRQTFHNLKGGKLLFGNGKVGVSKNRGKTPQIIHFNRVFYYFHHPFWWFYHYFWKHPSSLGLIFPNL